MDGNKIMYDESIPRPSLQMSLLADEIVDFVLENEFEEIDFTQIGTIDELGQLEDEMLYVSETQGIPAFKIL